MNKLKKYLFVLVSFLTATSYATHINGGEIFYECLGGNNYRITVKIYRECSSNNSNNTQFDPEITIGFFNAGGQLIKTEEFAFPGARILSPEVNDPCLLVPPNVCVEEAAYVQEVTLNDLPGGYNIVYQRCCRNPAIANLNEPRRDGMSLLAHVPDPGLADCNSSPQFNNYPPLVTCSDEPFEFDHGATDLDGDSLVYEFYNPFHGGEFSDPIPKPPSAPPFRPVYWTGSFHAQDPFNASPSFNINSQTGFVTGTPRLSGLFSVGIKVSEYRNGQLIGATHRDFMYNVTFCPPTVAAIPEQTVLCDGVTVNFQNHSANATGYEWNFGDPSTETADISTLASPTYVYPDTGTYIITLVANPGEECTDTSVQEYSVQLPIDPYFDPQVDDCITGNEYDFSGQGVFYNGQATFEWNLGDGAVPMNSTQLSIQDVVYTTPGVKQVSFTIRDRGCEETYYETFEIYPQPIAGIMPQNTFCDGLSLDFINTSIDALTYNWSFGDYIAKKNTSTELHPTYVFSDTGQFVVTLISTYADDCIDTTTQIFSVYNPISTFYNRPDPQCVTGNSFIFDGEGAESSAAIYQWDFPDLGQVVQGEIQQNISFADTGWHTVNLSLVDHVYCSAIHTDSVFLFPEPTIAFDLLQELNCFGDSVRFADQSFSYTNIEYLWDFGDGTTSTESNPSHFYNQTGTYDLSLTIKTDSGCVRTLSEIKPSELIVYPSPVADFTINPFEQTVFEPFFDLTDFSQNNIEHYYLFDNGDTVTDRIYHYVAQESGEIAITQLVLNQFGCPDTMQRKVYVIPKSLVYIPNSFTPNNDGINETFVPVVFDIHDYEFYIFNRWGDMIFFTNEIGTGWDGRDHLYRKRKTKERISQNLAKEDTYVYLVLFKDVNDKEHKLRGNVNLIR